MVRITGRITSCATLALLLVANASVTDQRFDSGPANGRNRRLGDEVGFYNYGPSPGGYAHWLPVSGRSWIGVTP